MSKYYPDQTQQVEFLIKTLDLNPEMKGLDLGCDKGVHLSIFKEKGFEQIVGFDKEYFGVEDTFKVDLFHDEFPVNGFDFVYLLSPYFGEDWWNLEVLLKKIERSLVKKGKFLMDFNNFNSMPVGLTINNWNKNENRVMINQITREQDKFVGTRTIISRDWSEEQIPLLWRIFERPEIKELFELCNLKIIAEYGGFNHEPINWNPNPNKSRIIILFEKQ